MSGKASSQKLYPYELEAKILRYDVSVIVAQLRWEGSVWRKRVQKHCHLGKRVVPILTAQLGPLQPYKGLAVGKLGTLDSLSYFYRLLGVHNYFKIKSSLKKQPY